MGTKVGTSELLRRLKAARRYEDAALTDMDELHFSEEFSKLIASKGISVQAIVDATGFSKSYVNKLRNLKEKKAQPTRGAVISLALALDPTQEEVDHLLKAAHYQQLYAKDTADSIILWGLMQGYTGKEIRAMLAEKGVGRDILRQE